MIEHTNVSSQRNSNRCLVFFIRHRQATHKSLFRVTGPEKQVRGMIILRDRSMDPCVGYSEKMVGSLARPL